MPTDFQLPSSTRIGSVHLQIRDLAQSLAFYGEVLGLLEISREEHAVSVSASGSRPELLRLIEIPDARPRPPHTTGLFHVAIRVSGRGELANVIKRLHSKRESMHGFANHGVSESVYLSDPDNNGIEIYCDLPRDRWPHEGNRIAMTTDPLDVDELLKLASNDWHGLDPVTDIGHVHLQVSDLKKAEDFYHGLLGFDVTQDSYPGALFFSAGGYHHHVATNVWSSRGGQSLSANSVGLRMFQIVVPDAEAVSVIRNRLEDAGVMVSSARANGLLGISTADYDGIGMQILSSQS